MKKTLKRETAGTVAIFNAIVYIFGLGLLIYRPEVAEQALDVAKYLTPFSITALTLAYGADFTAKQYKGTTI